jgi:hypothetical protein
VFSLLYDIPKSTHCEPEYFALTIFSERTCLGKPIQPDDQKPRIEYVFASIIVTHTQDNEQDEPISKPAQPLQHASEYY